MNNSHYQFNELAKVRLNRVLVHPDLQHNQTLKNFAWRNQKQARAPIRNWIAEWARHIFKGKEKPLPILHIWGANNQGKTHIAVAIGRFFALNFFSINSDALLCSVQLIRWIDYCKSQLNGGDIKIDPNASLLIIDDIDSYKPIPKSLSTWALEDAVNNFKVRAERDSLPIIITGNWDPNDLQDFFSTNASGSKSKETIQSARTLCSVISRNAYQVIHFNGDLDDKQGAATHKLPARAEAENDMEQLGFLFLEKYGITVQF